GPDGDHRPDRPGDAPAGRGAGVRPHLVRDRRHPRGGDRPRHPATGPQRVRDRAGQPHPAGDRLPGCRPLHPGHARRRHPRLRVPAAGSGRPGDDERRSMTMTGTGVLRPAPLDGVRVLEVGTVIMAPYAGKILTDLGADVIRAEPPGGDIGRRAGLLGPAGTAALSMNLNAGKRSIVVDARTPAGRRQMDGLVGWADIILTNMLPARRREFGLDWEQVHRRNPRAILVTGQGFASSST